MRLTGLSERRAQQRSRELLDAFIAEEEPRHARRRLEALIGESLRPVVSAVLTRVPASEFERVWDRTMSLLIPCLYAIREWHWNDADVRWLAADLAWEGLSETLSEADTAMRRLRQRLVYLLQARPAVFTLERDSFGISRFRTIGTPPDARGDRWLRFLTQPDVLLKTIAPDCDPGMPTDLPQLLESVLTWVGQPVPMGALAVAFAEAGAADDADTLTIRVAPSAPEAEHAEAAYLGGLLWRALQQQPMRPCVTLLMHLQRGDGTTGVTLLEELGVIQSAELAAALDTDEALLAELKRALPSTDEETARLIKSSPESIRLLRQAARGRLAPLLPLWG